MNKLKVLELLCELQKSCAPIELSIGTTREGSFVENDVIIIKDAPAIVTKRLTDEGYSLSTKSYGVEVDYYGDEEDKK